MRGVNGSSSFSISLERSEEGLVENVALEPAYLDANPITSSMASCEPL